MVQKHTLDSERYKKLYEIQKLQILEKTSSQNVQKIHFCDIKKFILLYIFSTLQIRYVEKLSE